MIFESTQLVERGGRWPYKPFVLTEPMLKPRRFSNPSAQLRKNRVIIIRNARSNRDRVRREVSGMYISGSNMLTPLVVRIIFFSIQFPCRRRAQGRALSNLMRRIGEYYLA